MSTKTYADLKAEFRKVPGSEEHMQKLSVILAKEIIRRRKELNMTQTQVVELAQKHGHSFTQATLSRVEAGTENIEIATYQKIFEALGGLISLRTQYSERPKSSELKTQDQILEPVTV